MSIRSPKLEETLPRLKGGESGVLELDLEPGEYHVWCPVGPHATLGMPWI